jgi:hypothetical protein
MIVTAVVLPITITGCQMLAFGQFNLMSVIITLALVVARLKLTQFRYRAIKQYQLENSGKINSGKSTTN